jgi:CYTH domain-containing protein
VSEIERKWLVAALPPDLRDGEPIRQGYVALDGDIEVRIRDRAGRCSLTVKRGSGLERDEIEIEIDRDAFDALWPIAEHRSIDKVRHVVDVAGHAAEVDRYRGRHEGLCVVEVEFGSTADAGAFEPPPWFGDEVTGAARWSNRALAVDGPPDN